MDKSLIRLLVKDSKLINFITGDVYRYKEAASNDQYIKAILKGEEKWNKYKLIYEEAPAKELSVSVSELIPGDKIPFFTASGKKLFEVRNMDIVAYTVNRETKKARVVYLGGYNENTMFTFVDREGKDISDTGKGYLAIQFAKEFNKRKKAVKRLPNEDGYLAEVDKRFNEEVKEDKKKVKISGELVPSKSDYKSLDYKGLEKRLKSLGFIYKNNAAYFKKEPNIAVKDKLTKEVITSTSLEVRLKKLNYFEGVNVANQLSLHDLIKVSNKELEAIKRKATIDVTEEEKANSNAIIERLNNKIKESQANLENLDNQRKRIYEDYHMLSIAYKNSKNQGKTA